MTPSDRPSRHKIISPAKDDRDGCGKWGTSGGRRKGKCWAKRLFRSEPGNLNLKGVGGQQIDLDSQSKIIKCANRREESVRRRLINLLTRSPMRLSSMGAIKKPKFSRESILHYQNSAHPITDLRRVFFLRNFLCTLYGRKHLIRRKCRQAREKA